ncbi:hypothetical protein U9M48_004196 [Paspalum notatum var. saurae]|uniref:Uncharacterized protein n=1 Tax=Paspalum notatum var. saurae TaxID=547442 RepID=A0AAQ3PV41_PASNO
MGSSDSDRSLRRDQALQGGLGGCSSRLSINVDDVIEPARRPRTHSQSQAQAQGYEEMEVDEDWKHTNEGFTLRSDHEEQRGSLRVYKQSLLRGKACQFHYNQSSKMRVRGSTSQNPPRSRSQLKEEARGGRKARGRLTLGGLAQLSLSFPGEFRVHLLIC